LARKLGMLNYLNNFNLLFFKIMNTEVMKKTEEKKELSDTVEKILSEEIKKNGAGKRVLKDKIAWGCVVAGITCKVVGGFIQIKQIYDFSLNEQIISTGIGGVGGTGFLIYAGIRVLKDTTNRNLRTLIKEGYKAGTGLVKEVYKLGNIIITEKYDNIIYSPSVLTINQYLPPMFK